MANSKLIVVEGAQGAGKTTITDYLRNSVKIYIDYVVHLIVLYQD